MSLEDWSIVEATDHEEQQEPPMEGVIELTTLSEVCEVLSRRRKLGEERSSRTKEPT